MLPHSRVHNEGMFLWRMDKTLEQLLHSNGTPPGVNKDASHPQLAAFRRKIRTRMIDQKYIHPHYQHVDGTSMAAPVVSAIVAQMLEANPTLSPSQVREILLATATPLPGMPAARYGAGLVNAGRAVAAARRLSRGLWRVLPFSPQVHPDGVSFFYFSPGNRAACVCLDRQLQQLGPNRVRPAHAFPRALAAGDTHPATRDAPLQIPGGRSLGERP